ncbi:MAG: hypothetical protein M1824_006011 [Vezdaea acicularis]|nr:MAG: hypothetical protein M1824_006011 [Vezdaea acicularis]
MPMPRHYIFVLAILAIPGIFVFCYRLGFAATYERRAYSILYQNPEHLVTFSSPPQITPTPVPYSHTVFLDGELKPPGSNYSRTLVIGRLKEQDVSWVDAIPNLNKAIYVVDDPTAPLHPPKNKGREATVYLSYIIDNYDSLPDVVLFFHAHQTAWHNNILLNLDSQLTIRRLSSERVVRTGYFPARCHRDPGCPDWIHLDRPEADYDDFKRKEERYFTSKIWTELHPLDPVPPALSQPCCAQFAVSRERIRSNPVSRYVMYRDWLMRTTLDDEMSGRVMEYIWQYIFTGFPEFCPVQHTCYCDGYGICFGSEANLAAWLDKLHRRDALDKELREWTEAKEKAEKGEGQMPEEPKDQTLPDIIKTLNEELEIERGNAYTAGRDPAIRAAAAGRAFSEA